MADIQKQSDAQTDPNLDDDPTSCYPEPDSLNIKTEPDTNYGSETQQPPEEEAQSGEESPDNGNPKEAMTKEEEEVTVKEEFPTEDMTLPPVPGRPKSTKHIEIQYVKAYVFGADLHKLGYGC